MQVHCWWPSPHSLPLVSPPLSAAPCPSSLLGPVPHSSGCCLVLAVTVSQGKSARPCGQPGDAYAEPVAKPFPPPLVSPPLPAVACPSSLLGPVLRPWPGYRSKPREQCTTMQATQESMECRNATQECMECRTATQQCIIARSGGSAQQCRKPRNACQVSVAKPSPPPSPVSPLYPPAACWIMCFSRVLAVTVRQGTSARPCRQPGDASLLLVAKPSLPPPPPAPLQPLPSFSAHGPAMRMAHALHDIDSSYR
jgi:hypothetical protein